VLRNIDVQGTQGRAAVQLDVIVAITRTLLIAGLTIGLAAGAPAATQASWQDPPPATTSAQPPP